MLLASARGFGLGSPGLRWTTLDYAGLRWTTLDYPGLPEGLEMILLVARSTSWRSRTSRARPAAESRAAELLKGRFMFRAELASRLADEGYDRAECEGAMKRMEELGYVDDLRHARELAARLARSGAARARIRAELLAAGAPAPVAEEAATAAWEGRDEREAALRLARERVGDASSGSLARVARRLTDLGYEESVVGWVLERLAGAPRNGQARATD